MADLDKLNSENIPLSTYIETRFNLLTVKMDEGRSNVADRAEELRLALDAKFKEMDLRYEQRFQAQKLAIDKSDAATEKRFEGVNEFRQTLADQASSLMSRVEAMALINSLNEKFDDNKNRIIVMESLKLGGKQQREGVSQVTQIVATIIGILVPASVLIVAMSKLKSSP